MPNRLASQRSLYLRQHADQPVDWWPWCPEAFAEARKRDVPVLVSVGYASCHWCHVMARECFDDAYIADLMNRHFVCIKVDREERPDVDKFHMDAVQMIQHHGGWPLNCFCLADGRPFFGGTYFPPEDRGRGQTPWPQVLMRVAEFHRSNRASLEENAAAITGNLLHLTRAPDADGQGPDAEARLAAARAICTDADDTHGGFGGAPKFPPAMPLAFLLAVRERRGLPAADRTRIDAVLRRTLDAMDQGGLHDQIGGGFSRYCVDREWTVPHFEKLLCDNALLLGVYARAAVALREPRYAEVCAEIVGWLQREMRAGKTFAASIDADTNHEEGLTYVWTPAEVATVLGDRSPSFCKAFGITPDGNFEGKRSVPTFRTAAQRADFREDVTRLLAARNLRPQPARDDKQLVGWNALLATNLARAGDLLGQPTWRGEAEAIVAALGVACREVTPGQINVSALVDGDAPGTLTDAIWLAEAHLSIAARGEARHVTSAARLVRSALARFGDSREIGCFLNPVDANGLPVRQKDWWDNAIPAGNSSLLGVLATLEARDNEGEWGRLRTEFATAYAGMTRNAPHGIGRALEALEIGDRGITVIHHGPGPARSEALKALFGLCEEIHLVESTTDGLQLCRGRTCLSPASTAEALRRQLAE